MADRDTADMLSKMSGEYDRMTVAASHPAPLPAGGPTAAAQRATATAPPHAGAVRSRHHRRARRARPALVAVGVAAAHLNPWHRQRQAYGL